MRWQQKNKTFLNEIWCRKIQSEHFWFECFLGTNVFNTFPIAYALRCNSVAGQSVKFMVHHCVHVCVGKNVPWRAEQKMSQQFSRNDFSANKRRNIWEARGREREKKRIILKMQKFNSFQHVSTKNHSNSRKLWHISIICGMKCWWRPHAMWTGTVHPFNTTIYRQNTKTGNDNDETVEQYFKVFHLKSENVCCCCCWCFFFQS